MMSLLEEVMDELNIAYDAGQAGDGLDVDQAKRTINKILDAAVKVAKQEKVGANASDSQADIYYDLAIDDVVRGLNKLRMIK